MTASISSIDLDAAIIGYLRYLNKEQKEAILNVMKVLAPAQDADGRWSDPDFVAEMDRRVEECRTGAVRTYTIDEVMEGTRQVIAEVRKKKKR